MLKKIFFLFLFTTVINAQHVVKGNMKPIGNYTWIILYQLQGAKQNYITNTTVTNGEFTIAIPEKTPKGIYRMVYDIKNRLFVDFIYDNENVTLTFNPKHPSQYLEFTASENNKLYRAYIEAITSAQQKLDSLQVSYLQESDSVKSQKIRMNYVKSHQYLKVIQELHETSSKDKLVNHFINARARYNSMTPIKNSSEYLNITKEHFFDNIDFNSEALLNSSFINDKINDFIFYVNTSDDQKVLTQLQKDAISTVINKIGSNKILAKDIEEGLLYTFSQQQNITMVNYMLNQYMQLPKELQDAPFIKDIRGQLKTAVGMLVPNILWKENSTQKDLYSLTNATYYVVTFWSSTCSHCLKELPILYDFLKNKPQVKVVAIGLEDDSSKAGWKTQISAYPNFVNVYGENKWQNKFARNYGVNATPSFFVLDADKKVIAKPDDVEELKVFFDKKLSIK